MRILSMEIDKRATTTGKRKIIVALLGLSLVLALFAAFAPESVAAERVIEGLVLNKTGGENPVRYQEVELTEIRPDGSTEIGPVTKTDEFGRFRFANIASSDSVTRTIATKFQGVEYRAVVRPQQGAGSAQSVDLAVYDSSDDVKLQADISHLVIEVDPATRDLTVLEIAIISNSTDKTLIPGTKGPSGSGRSLWFPLPPGALHPEVTEGLDSVSSFSDEGGLGYSGPILPGKRQVVYSYMLENPGSSFTISKPLAYSSPKVNVLMADVGQRISNSNLAAQQPVTIKDRSYLFFTGESFEPGGKLELNVSNFPSPTSEGQGIGSLNDTKWMVLVAVVIAGLAAAVSYNRLRGPRGVTAVRDHAPQTREITATAQERAQLLAAISEMDNKFEAGEISLEQYREQREEIKQKLRQIRA